MGMDLRVAVAVALAGGLWLDAPQTPVRTFDTEPVNQAPAGFVLAAMRQPTAGVWLVKRPAGDGVLTHDALAAHRGFGIALTGPEVVRDVSLVVRLRLAGGSRAGGLVWRYQNPDNHYQVVLDLGRRRLAMYRVVSGNHVRVEDEEGLDLDPAAWHTLKIAHDDSRVRVSLGGIRVFEDDDRTFRAGRVGLLAAGDAEVWFDDLRIDVDRRSR